MLQKLFEKGRNKFCVHVQQQGRRIPNRFSFNNPARRKTRKYHGKTNQDYRYFLKN